MGNFMGKVKIFLTLLFPLVTSLAFAQTWQIKLLTNKAIKQRANYRLIRFVNPQTKQSITIHTVILNKKSYAARVVDQKPLLSFLSFKSIYQTTQQQEAFLGINGGFFTPENVPLGLVIIQGKHLSPLARQSTLLSGLVLINKSGQINLTWRNANYKHAFYALQAGPFLIQPGGKLALRSQGELKRRTALALSKNHLVVISSSPTSLYNLAYLLKHFPNAFGVSKITTALNLDGGSSTSMTLFAPDQNPLIISEILPVRNALVFKLK